MRSKKQVPKSFSETFSNRALSERKLAMTEQIALTFKSC